MKILVINTGSSSIKYELFDMEHHRVMASGMAEKIGEDTSLLTHKGISPNGDPVEKMEDAVIADHLEGMNRIVQLLVDPDLGPIQAKSEISAVGHRVVHGGEAFHSTTIIDKKVIAAIRKNIPLAPLHNPPNLVGIEITTTLFPDAPQVAVFDTAFHQTIPMKAFLYALPLELYREKKVRRYGFHGTSHAYVAESAADYLGQSLAELNLITIHLGNGASMAAIKRGKCVDTTMGMTPLEGLVMGSRSGDVDPAIPFFLSDQLGMSFKDIDGLLNKDSGLRGLCGTNDMREVLEKKDAGDDRARMALEVYCYRIKKYIGAYFAALESLDVMVFTAGIGENAPYIRELSCSGLNGLGIELDREQNHGVREGIKEISSPKSHVRVLVIPTNEELKIAQETKRVLQNILVK